MKQLTLSILLSGLGAIVHAAPPDAAPSTSGTSSYTFTTLAGSSGNAGSADGNVKEALFSEPEGIAVDSNGNIYVADTGNNTIRKITPAGTVSTLAGSAGKAGSEDGTGDSVRFNRPTGVAVDASGNVYVADSKNAIVRKITPEGFVDTLAGKPGVLGRVDARGPEARFETPTGIAVDANGNVYVTDITALTIRKITPLGVVSTIAGRAGIGAHTDGGKDEASFNSPCGIALDSTGNVYVADSQNAVIRKITPEGIVSTLAGSGSGSVSSDRQVHTGNYDETSFDGSVLI